MENNIFDQDPHDQGSTFLKTFAATMVGAYVGHKLDQTRFGVWFNNSRVIGMIYQLIFVGVIMFAAYSVFYILNYVLTH